MRNISYSDGSVVPSVIAIWDDLHAARPGLYRAFWVSDPLATLGSLRVSSPMASRKRNLHKRPARQKAVCLVLGKLA